MRCFEIVFGCENSRVGCVGYYIFWVVEGKRCCFWDIYEGVGYWSIEGR